MNRTVIILLAAALAWWFAQRWEHRPIAYPAGVLVDASPRQVGVPDSVFRFDDYILTRRAKFSLVARVLSTERYYLGREADLSPIDLALGWNVMSDQSVLDRIEVSQRGRWYYTRWEMPPPVPESLMVGNSGNMHMIPDRGGIERKLKSLRPGDIIRLDGFLVDVDHPSGWHWRTSMSREDSGAGACEIVYVESLILETDNYLTN